MLGCPAYSTTKSAGCMTLASRKMTSCMLAATSHLIFRPHSFLLETRSLYRFLLFHDAL